MPKISPSETEALFKQFYQNHDPALREKIILNHLELVDKLVKKFSGKGISKEALHSVGCIALIHAVDRYNPNLGTLFSTYAYSIIAGEIKHHFRDQAWDVSVPRGLKSDYLRVNKEVEKLTQKMGRSPTFGDLANHLEMSQERIIEVLEVGKDYQSLSLEAPDFLTPLAKKDQDLEKMIDSIDLKKALKHLSGREQLIIELALIFEMTQQEISKRLGMSQIHVSRLLRGALEKLREMLKE